MQKSTVTSAKKVIFIDPALSGLLGHHYYEISRFLDLINFDGEYKVFANKKCAVEFPNSRTAVIPYFNLSIYDVNSFKIKQLAGVPLLIKFIRSIDNALPFKTPHLSRNFRHNLKKQIFSMRALFTEHNNSLLDNSIYADEINQIIKEYKLGENDHIVIPTAEIELTAAVLNICISQNIKTLPTFHLRYLNIENTKASLTETYDNLFLKLKQTGFIDSKIHLYTETRPHAQVIEGLVEGPVHIVPHPVERHRPASSSFIHQKRKCRIGYVGVARKEKGIDLIADIVEIFARDHPALLEQCEFIVQAKGETDEARNILQDLFNRIECKDYPVHFVKEALDIRNYQRLIGGLDIILLPYNSKIYKNRGSGILSESIINGIPFVCSRGSYLEGFINFNNGLSGRTPKEYADCLAEIIAEYKKYEENAALAAKDFEELIQNNALSNLSTTL